MMSDVRVSTVGEAAACSLDVPCVHVSGVICTFGRYSEDVCVSQVARSQLQTTFGDCCFDMKVWVRRWGVRERGRGERYHECECLSEYESVCVMGSSFSVERGA